MRPRFQLNYPSYKNIKKEEQFGNPVGRGKDTVTSRSIPLHTPSRSPGYDLTLFTSPLPKFREDPCISSTMHRAQRTSYHSAEIIPSSGGIIYDEFYVYFMFFY